MDPLFAKHILEKTRQDYDAIALSFSETRGRTDDCAPLVRDVGIGASVLDVGCGNGRLFDVLPVGVLYTGCDTSERMLALARARHVVPLPNVRYAIGDVLSLPFPDASFDHVFALAVLHHIPSAALRQQAARELARIVKPRGRITITVWNLWNPRWLWRYGLWQLLFGIYPKGYDRGDCLVPWRRGLDTPIMRYIHAFTRNALRMLCERAGLRIITASRGRNHTIVAEKR